MKANGSTEKDKDVQSAIILLCAGPQMIEVFDHYIPVRRERDIYD